MTLLEYVMTVVVLWIVIGVTCPSDEVYPPSFEEDGR